VQNELTLSATKLAAEFLRPNGTFVTKVFRSTDYTALIWVFQQLFWKVEQTKPSSSRAVSAEIFVICKGYKGNVNDPKLFDPEFVFMDPAESAKKAAAESGNSKLADLMKHQDKKKRGGYENDNTRKTESLVNFVKHPNPATLLMSCAELTIEDDESKNLLEGYYNRSFPEAELRECCKDLQLLGRGELTKLIKWRMKTRKEHQEREKEARKREAARAAKEAEKAGEEGEGKGRGGKDGKDSDGESGKEDEDGKSEDDEEMKELEKDAETNEELANMIKEMKQQEKRDLKKVRKLNIT
jgi:AdoMet-dependent rRNA methyltransferase SPB1